jgi:homoserine kinase
VIPGEVASSSLTGVPDFIDGPVTVRVPATSANLGPGFDSLGVALSLYDEVSAEPATGATTVAVAGEGAGQLPADHTHLVAASLHAACRARGRSAPAVRLHCRNAIPQARGLGSSSAAIVAGVLLARHLLADEDMDDAVMLDIASRLEGHPDNVAPCLLGGFTIAWTEDETARALSCEPVAGLHPVVYVPDNRSLTSQARAALPGKVPHVDAAFNIARAALAVRAFTHDPSLLMTATEDRIHQWYRAPAMPSSAALVDRLREAGIPAVISGAGPTVLAFTTSPPVAEGFQVHGLSVASGAYRL